MHLYFNAVLEIT